MALLVLKVAGLVAAAPYNAFLAFEAVAQNRRPRRVRAFGSSPTAAILLGVAIYLIGSYRSDGLTAVY